MRLTWEDAVATAATAGVAALYVGLATEADWAPLQSVRVTAAATLVLGVTACAVGGAQTTRDSAVMSGPEPFVGGLTAILLGFAVLTGWVPLLGISVGMICLLWLTTTVRHLRGHPPVAAPEPGRALVHHDGYRR